MNNKTISLSEMREVIKTQQNIDTHNQLPLSEMRKYNQTQTTPFQRFSAGISQPVYTAGHAISSGLEKLGVPGATEYKKGFKQRSEVFENVKQDSWAGTIGNITGSVLNPVDLAIGAGAIKSVNLLGKAGVKLMPKGVNLMPRSVVNLSHAGAVGGLGGAAHGAMQIPEEGESRLDKAEKGALWGAGLVLVTGLAITLLVRHLKGPSSTPPAAKVKQDVPVNPESQDQTDIDIDFPPP